MPWVLTVSETEEVLGRPVQRWEDSSGGYRQLIWSESEGLLLLGSHTFAGPTIYFDQPLVLIPPDYQLGTLHRAEADVRMAEGDSERTGTLTSELTASQTAPVSTPAGRFEDCLLVEVSFALETQEGTQELDLEVMLAAGVGPVLIKASGTDAELDLVLAEARVGSTVPP